MTLKDTLPHIFQYINAFHRFVETEMAELRFLGSASQYYGRKAKQKYRRSN